MFAPFPGEGIKETHPLGPPLLHSNRGGRPHCTSPVLSRESADAETKIIPLRSQRP